MDDDGRACCGSIGTDVCDGCPLRMGVGYIGEERPSVKSRRKA